MNSNLISILIPVFNSEKTIEKLVRNLVETLKEKYLFEIVLVNDCSTDSSEKKCTQLFSQYSDFLKFYSLAKNVGEHNAVMAGLHKVKGEYVVIMDDDFQNPVDEVKKLIDFANKKNFDVVYTFYSKKQHSFYRNLGSKFNNFVATLMLKKPKNLYLSSFKILNQFITQEVIKYDLPYPYIDGLILRTTQNIGTIEVRHDKSKKPKSSYTFKKLISLWLNMFTNFSIFPLRMATVIGFCFAIFGFIFGLQTIYEKFINPDIPIGYSAIIILLAVFSGVQLITIGMIGEYLGRVFLSQSKKPQFTIRYQLSRTQD